MDAKLCWFCKHFYWSNAIPNYSEWTPGSDFEMSCGKGHWSFDAFKTSQQKFQQMIETAKTCSDFVQIQGLK